MFTSRGYRRSKRENKNISRQGQIIQKKPFFIIDNNPVVLEAYRKFLMGSTSTPAPTPSTPTFDSDTYNITLSEHSLGWSTTTDLNLIYAQLLTFAQNIFAQFQTDGKYPLSLELYSPNLDDTKQWAMISDTYDSSFKHSVAFKSIIIDRLGNLSLTQNLDYNLLYSVGNTTSGKGVLTIGYISISDIATPTRSSPTTMKLSVNYFTL